MKITVEIEDSDISELLWDRIESYGIELTNEKFDKIFEKYKEELRDILQMSIEEEIGSIYTAGGAFEDFIERHGLNEDEQ